jgi:ubiquinone/menaquinone biosynthesis C-methylase UbiE
MPPDYRQSAEATWDAIAESFDATRRIPWRQCLEYIHTLKKTDTVADVGCGNGRHLILCAEQCQHVVGVDLSRNLLSIVSDKIQKKNVGNVSLIHADVVRLPIRDNSMDAILFIASLHNIRGKEPRHRALQEIFRILKPGRSAFISVWSRWQEKYYLFFVRQFFLRHRDFGDIDLLWRQHNLEVPRFYHLYSKAEFVKELRDADFSVENVQSETIHSRRFPDNYFALVRKR